MAAEGGEHWGCGRGWGAGGLLSCWAGPAVAAGGGRGSQTYLGPWALAAPGDMMIDGVSPPAGMRSLSLFRPSAWPCAAGRVRADSLLRELAAVVSAYELACRAGYGLTCRGGQAARLCSWPEGRASQSCGHLLSATGDPGSKRNRAWSGAVASAWAI